MIAYFKELLALCRKDIIIYIQLSCVIKGTSIRNNLGHSAMKIIAYTYSTCLLLFFIYAYSINVCPGAAR